MYNDKFLSLNKVEHLNDKIEIFHTLFNIEKKSDRFYQKDKLAVQVSDFSLNNVKAGLKDYSSYFFDLYVTFKLYDEFTYNEKFSVSLPSDLSTKKNLLTQSEINQFIAKVLSYVFMQYGHYAKLAEGNYEIYRFENSIFYKMGNLIDSKSFSPKNFSIYKFSHTGREYFKAGNSNEDPVDFAIIRYFVKYNHVFVKDGYLDSITSKHDSGSSHGSRMEEKKVIKVDKEMTELFSKVYNVNDHRAFLALKTG